MNKLILVLAFALSSLTLAQAHAAGCGPAYSPIPVQNPQATEIYFADIPFTDSLVYDGSDYFVRVQTADKNQAFHAQEGFAGNPRVQSFSFVCEDSTYDSPEFNLTGSLLSDLRFNLDHSTQIQSRMVNVSIANYELDAKASNDPAVTQFTPIQTVLGQWDETHLYRLSTTEVELRAVRMRVTGALQTEERMAVRMTESH